MAQYWDGQAWTGETGPAAAPPSDLPQGSSLAAQASSAVSSINDNQMAMFAHLGQLLGLVSGIGGFLVPLIIMLTKGKESEFVRRAAVESLNFWITGLLAGFVAIILVAVLIGIPLLFLVGLVWTALPVYAGIKAADGVDYRYPFNIRIVR